MKISTIIQSSKKFRFVVIVHEDNKAIEKKFYNRFIAFAFAELFNEFHIYSLSNYRINRLKYFTHKNLLK